jgi:hypothetical protein
VPSARTWRRAAATGGLGLTGVYAFDAAQYHRTAAKDVELEDPPGSGSPDFARMVEALTLEDREGARPGAWVRRLTATCARTTSRPAG